MSDTINYNLRDPDGIVHIAEPWEAVDMRPDVASLRCHPISGLSRAQFARKGYTNVPDGTTATCITCLFTEEG